MEIACLDLEGVLVPEIWISVAKRTGIEALSLTTRDVADYDELMQHRIARLDERGLTFSDIRPVIAGLEPLDGALAFLEWLRARCQVIIASDTFYEFATPLMPKLGWPALFCNRLEIDERGRLAGYRLRQPDQKRETVKALRGLDFRVIAVGDSYNDTSMLAEADRGIFFRPSESVRREFPHFPVTRTYAELQAAFALASRQDAEPG